MPAATPRRLFAYRWVVVGLLAAAGVASWWFWPRPAPPAAVVEAVPLVEEPEERPPIPENPGYIGPGACRECHTARVEGFEPTRHRHACWPADQGPMPAAFPEAYAAQLSPDARFDLSHDPSGYLLAVTRRGRRFTRRIDLVYGSAGTADEVYFSWKGNHLVELPLGWLHPTHEWAEQRYNPNHPTDFSRTTTARCVECHNTWVAHVRGSENEYRPDGAVFGVTCENCHGPGRDHAAHHRAHPGGGPGHAVVHPGRLPRERQTDVCGQCHSNAMRPRGPAFSFRPGDRVDDHFYTLAATGREHDHVAGQAGYLRQSKCYTRSDSLTCVTCHNPHTASDPAAVRRACAKCHAPADCRDQPNLPEAVRPDCVGCHMPRYTRVAVNFHTPAERYVFPVRPADHRIAVHAAAREEVLWEYYRQLPDATSRARAAELATGLATHYATAADRAGREWRFLEAVGAARDAARFDPSPAARNRVKAAADRQVGLDDGFHAAEQDQAAGHPREAARRLEELLRLKPNWAGAHAKLGTVLAALGDRGAAVGHLEAVARYDPDDAHGLNMLGWLAYLDGRPAVAADYFEKTARLTPFSAEMLYRHGLALLARRDWPAAADRFAAATAADPRHAGGWQGLSHARVHLGDAAGAVEAARRAARLTRYENADALISLADALAAAGNRGEALGAARKALVVAYNAQPQAVDAARRKAEELEKP